jgi:O-antigen/teichoic acid export membrane protein
MNLLYTAVSLVLNILLIPGWGIQGALAATGMAQLVMLAYLVYHGRKFT